MPQFRYPNIDVTIKQPGGLREYWIPPTWAKDIKDKINDQHQLHSSASLEGLTTPTSVSSTTSAVIRSSVRQAAAKFAGLQTGPIIHPKALKVVEAMRGGSRIHTYAGRCLSLTALKDITENAHANRVSVIELVCKRTRLTMVYSSRIIWGSLSPAGDI
jgi:hypothetical protein